jgi:hypothetical protein
MSPGSIVACGGSFVIGLIIIALLVTLIVITRRAARNTGACPATPVVATRNLISARRDIASPTQEPGRVYFLSDGVGTSSPYNLRGQQIRALELPGLDGTGLSVDDILEAPIHGERWLVASTGTRAILLHSPTTSRIVEANVAPEDLALHNGRLYALAGGQIHSAAIEQLLVPGARITFRHLPILQDQHVLALERTHGHGAIIAITRDGTFFLRNDQVFRRQQAVRGMVCGATEDEYITPENGGVRMQPNDEYIPDVDAVVITPDNRLYGLHSAANPWVRRVRVLSNEPAIISERGTLPPEVLH